MNLKKLIVIILLFTGLSWYYFHYEIDQRERAKAARAPTSIVELNESDDITFLSLESEKGTVTLAKDDKGMWNVIAPVAAPADQFVVDGIAKTIRLDKRIRTFTDTTFDNAEVGLDTPSLRIGIGWGNKKRFLLIGDITRFEEQYYARWEDSDEVFLVSENFRNVFFKDLYSVRNKKMFDVPLGSIGRIAIDLSASGASVVLERRQGTRTPEWWIAGDNQNRADERRMYDYFAELQGILAHSFCDGLSADDPKTGLTASERTVVLTTKTGDLRIAIGSSVDDPASTVHALYARIGTGPVFAIAEDTVTSLAKSAEFFREKRMLPFPWESVRTITYTKDTRVVQFEKNDKGWTEHDVKKPLAADKTTVLDNLAFFVSEMPYTNIAASDYIAKLNLTDIDAIAMLAFSWPDDAKGMTVTFYAKNNMFFVKEAADPNYFVIADDVYNELNRLLKTIVS